MMIEPEMVDRLMSDARSVLRGHFRTRPEDDGIVVDLTTDDGTILWPNYANGPDELHAVLSAEQRYLTEQKGRGSVDGATYLNKAAERIRRAKASDES